MVLDKQSPPRHASLVLSLALGLATTVACRSASDGDAHSSAVIDVPAGAFFEGVASGSRSAPLEASSETPSPRRATNTDSGLAAAYSRALALEEQDGYPEAVAVYDELLDRKPDYRDARERRATLRAFIELAEQSYAAALAADSPRGELEHLRLIRSFWPDYEDVAERIGRIIERAR